MTDEQAPAKESLWDKVKGWFTTAKDSEAAEKMGDAAGKAWDKTKDVAEDVKEWGEEKIDDLRDKDDDDEDDKGEGEGEEKPE